MKKILSIFVSVMLLLSLMPTMASAAANTEVTIDSVEVNATAPTLIEAEDVVLGNSSFATQALEGASGGVVVKTGEPSSAGAYSNYTKSIDIPLNILAAGNYDIQAAVTHTGNKLPENYSWVNVYVDGTKIIGTWHGSGYTIEKTYTSTYGDNAPLKVLQKSDYSFETVGEHTLTVEIQCAGSYTNSIPNFNLDYFKLIPDGYVFPVDVSATEPTLFEMEDYYTNKAAFDGMSGDYYAKAGTLKDENGTVIGGETVTLPITVPADGMYNLEAALALRPGNLASYWSGTYIRIDDETATPVLANWGTDKAGAISTYASSPDNNYPITVYRAPNVWLTAGEHKFIIKTDKPASNSPQLNFDYMKLIPQSYAPAVEAVDVKANAATVIEAENVVAGNNAFKTATLDNVSSGSYILSNEPSGVTSYKSYKAKINVPLNVAQAGKYDFEAAFSDAGSTNEKNITWVHVYIDDVKIDSNWYGQGTAVSTYETSPISVAPIKVRQVAGYNFDTAGEHTLTIEVECVNSYTNSLPMFSIDYAKFTPVPTITENGTSYTATAVLDEAVTGKVILALYNGNDEMVGVGFADAANTTSITVTADNVSAGAVTAKLMVWKDLDDVEPLLSAIEFANTNGTWAVTK